MNKQTSKLPEPTPTVGSAYGIYGDTTNTLFYFLARSKDDGLWRAKITDGLGKDIAEISEHQDRDRVELQAIKEIESLGATPQLVGMSC